ncbi:unnamed protein product [Psylliodes chrysocephalus]|uniref:CHK kinase-like domain-containing protein n=1 Tax=Psylliodes chrysocephalus TaxID=3402493 RepID=A0A9P0D1P2_9CUCU|nr:unnamed protein product [Psylliodes chrysocephala]
MIINAIIQTLVDEIKRSNVKTNYMQIDLINVTELSDIIEKNVSNIDYLENIKICAKKLLQQRNQELKILEENIVRKIIYKAVKLIFENTTQEERFLFLNHLLETTYDLLVQNLVQLNKHSSIISRDDYKCIIRSFIPIVKLEAVLEHDNKYIIEDFIQYLQHPEILIEDTYEIIKKKFYKQDFEYINFELIPITAKIGFLGVYANLKIYTRLNGQKTTSNFFIKFLPKEGDENQTIAVNSFIKEKLFYTKFIDLLDKIESDDWNFLPKCYLVSEKFMVLEDLSIQGYFSVKIFTNFDHRYCSLTVKRLAKMHAGSILLEEKLSEKIGTEIRIDEYFPEMISETLILKNSFNIVSMEHILEYLKKFPHIVKDITMEEFQSRARKNLNQIFDKVKTSEKFRNVVTHGDIWCNNIFYKCDQNHRPTECLLLDFQIIRYVPPAMDVLLFLYTNINKTSRNELTKTLLDEYYTELKLILKKHNIIIEKIIPLVDFLKSMEDLKICAIYLSTLYHYLHALRDFSYYELLNPKEVERFWSEKDFRIKIFDRSWDTIKKNQWVEDNVIELYEYCLKNM